MQIPNRDGLSWAFRSCRGITALSTEPTLPHRLFSSLFSLSPSLSLSLSPPLTLYLSLSLILFLTRKFLLSYIHSVNTCFLCLVLARSNNKIYNEKRIEFSIVTLYTQRDRLNLEKRGHFSRVILRSSCL